MDQLRRDTRHGFSLLEVTLTVMLIGIVAAVATPVYTNSLLSYRSDVTAQRIAQDLSRAKQFARQTNSPCTVSFDKGLHHYTISGLTSLDNRGGVYLVAVNQAPYSSAVLSLTTAGEPTTQLMSMSLSFDRFGMPNQGVSIIIGTGAIQKRVDVAPKSGKISIQ